MTGTVNDFIAFAESQLGVPYVYGGSSPATGFDCSGLVEWCAAQCGVTVARTTQGEWVDPGLEHIAEPELGCLVEFQVTIDSGYPPQHVGIWLQPGVMIDAPTTGEDVSYQPIPDNSVIWPIGYLRITGLSAPAPIPPPVPSAVIKKISGRYGVLNAPVTAIVSTKSGQGYTEVAADGGTFCYGDAVFLGSLANLKLVGPIVDAAGTPDGKGLYMVGTDGGVFALGDAKFYGSAAGKKLVAPITSIGVTPSGKGYWLTGADGGIFAYGVAGFHGTPA